MACQKGEGKNRSQGGIFLAYEPDFCLTPSLPPNYVPPLKVHKATTQE